LLTKAEQVFAPRKTKALKGKADGSSKPKSIAASAPATREKARKKAA
jgi:hypothetical protein